MTIQVKIKHNCPTFDHGIKIETFIGDRKDSEEVVEPGGERTKNVYDGVRVVVSEFKGYGK